MYSLFVDNDDNWVLYCQNKTKFTINKLYKQINNKEERVEAWIRNTHEDEITTIRDFLMKIFL